MLNTQFRWRTLTRQCEKSVELQQRFQVDTHEFRMPENLQERRAGILRICPNWNSRPKGCFGVDRPGWEHIGRRESRNVVVCAQAVGRGVQLLKASFVFRSIVKMRNEKVLHMRRGHL